MKTVTFAAMLAGLCLVGSGEGTAEAREDWSRRDGSQGLVFYRCKSRQCGPDALVSCQVRNPNLIGSLERFDELRTRQFAEMRAKGFEVEPGRRGRGNIGAWVLYRDVYAVSAPGERGRSQNHRGFLVGSTMSFSIVSTSTDEHMAGRNFVRLVSRLAALPPSEGRAACTPSQTGSNPSDGAP